MNAYITLADGGLAVDTSCASPPGGRGRSPACGRPAPPARAACSCSTTGLHIGWAMVSGRIAGRRVAQAQNRLDLKVAEPVLAG